MTCIRKIIHDEEYPYETLELNQNDNKKAEFAQLFANRGFCGLGMSRGQIAQSPQSGSMKLWVVDVEADPGKLGQR